MRDLSALPTAHLHRSGRTTPRYAGFAAFAEVNGAVRDCLRRPEDFVRIAREFCADQHADGVRYAEVTFTAASHGERLGAPEMPLAAVLEGLAIGRAETGLQVQVLLDHPRRRSVERFRRTSHWLRGTAGGAWSGSASPARRGTR